MQALCPAGVQSLPRASYSIVLQISLSSPDSFWLLLTQLALHVCVLQLFHIPGFSQTYIKKFGKKISFIGYALAFNSLNNTVW